MPIETVFLDAGGVLIHPNWTRVSVTFARHGLDVSAAALRDAEPDVKFGLDTDDFIAASTDADRGGRLFTEVLDRAGVPRGAAREAALDEIYAYHMAHNLWEEVDPETRGTLAALRARGLKLAVVSNANGVVHRAFERGGLHGCVDVICDSQVEGVEKPDPRFFQIVLERTGSRPDRTLHVGDLYHVDVIGARRAGLHALLLDPHNLYTSHDVDRIRTLSEVVEYVSTFLIRS